MLYATKAEGERRFGTGWAWGLLKSNTSVAPQPSRRFRSCCRHPLGDGFGLLQRWRDESRGATEMHAMGRGDGTARQGISAFAVYLYSK